MNNIEIYSKPANLDEALKLLHAGGKSAKLIAGGVDIVRIGSFAIKQLIDISALELSYITEHDEALAIGATTTLTKILESDIAGSYLNGIIVDTLSQVASPSLRNMSTIGGSLASAYPWSDIITALVALDAKVTLRNGNEEKIPLLDLYTDKRLLSNAIITEITLPSCAPHTAASFAKFRRTYFDVAILNCACRITTKNERCKQAIVSVGGLPRLAQRLTDVEQALINQKIEPSLIEQAAQLASSTTPTKDDKRASAVYRQQLVYAGIKQVLTEADKQLRKA